MLLCSTSHLNPDSTMEIAYVHESLRVDETVMTMNCEDVRAWAIQEYMGTKSRVSEYRLQHRLGLTTICVKLNEASSSSFSGISRILRARTQSGIDYLLDVLLFRRDITKATMLWQSVRWISRTSWQSLVSNSCCNHIE